MLLLSRFSSLIMFAKGIGVTELIQRPYAVVSHCFHLNSSNILITLLGKKAQETTYSHTCHGMPKQLFISNYTSQTMCTRYRFRAFHHEILKKSLEYLDIFNENKHKLGL